MSDLVKLANIFFQLYVNAEKKIKKNLQGIWPLLNYMIDTLA